MGLSAEGCTVSCSRIEPLPGAGPGARAPNGWRLVFPTGTIVEQDRPKSHTICPFESGILCGSGAHAPHSRCRQHRSQGCLKSEINHLRRRGRQAPLSPGFRISTKGRGLRLAGAALLCLISALGAVSARPDTLIVNPNVAIESLSRDEARLYLSKRLTQWPDGERVRVFVLPDSHPVHEQVMKTLLGLYPYQLRRAWDRQLFSGTGQAPETVASEWEMINRVARMPGALGYVESSLPDSSVRALEIR